MERELSRKEIASAKGYIVDSFRVGDSGWIEGWICGFTDSAHGYRNSEEVREELFDLLIGLRDQKEEEER